MKLRFLLIILLAISLLSCDSTDPQDYAKAIIDQILTDIEINFNSNNLVELMKNYHSNYRQYYEGYYLDYDDILERWEIRLANHALIEINDLDIELQGDFWATAKCTLIFISDEGTIEYSEPSSENGDISYFYKNSAGEWKICGKDFINY